MVDTFEDIRGLSAEEVAAAVAAGDVNVDAGVKTRSIREILYSNIVTLFNIVNVILILFQCHTDNGHVHFSVDTFGFQTLLQDDTGLVTNFHRLLHSLRDRFDGLLLSHLLGSVQMAHE